MFVPIFFIHMGMRTHLDAFLNPHTLMLTALLTIVATLGKLIAGLGARNTSCNRLLIGVGMIPRGEVGLIFASTGLALTHHGIPVLSESIFASIIGMVMLTTFITPIFLKKMSEKSPIYVIK